MSMRALLLCLAAGMAAFTGSLWIAGCGGAGGPTWSSSGPSLGGSHYSGSGGPAGGTGRGTVPPPAGVVTGVVEVPAPPSDPLRAVTGGPWLRLGTPAHAASATARQPLAGARVALIDRATRQEVSPTVVTNRRGEFRIDRVTPSNRFSLQATDGQVTLEAVIPTLESGSQEVRVSLNEATTIGAEAARLAEEEGIGPEAAVLLAGQIAERQEALQAEQATELPDLTRAEEVVARAREHLLQSANQSLAALLEAKEWSRAQAARALASGQLLARSRFKLSRKVRLTTEQVEALLRALAAEKTRTTSAEKVAAALRKAGVKMKGKPVTAAQVGTALDSLREPLPCLKATKTDAIPVLAALLLAEQGDTGFQIATREQMKTFLKELVGEAPETPAPGDNGKPTTAATGPDAP